MNTFDRAAGLLAVATWLALATGCMTSHGLLQTAHTEPPRQLRFNAGAAGAINEATRLEGRGFATSATPELSMRFGLSEFMDAGLSPWLSGGASVDTKVNLLDNTARAALAPRLAVGYAHGERSTFGLELGVIGSYRLDDGVEPYVGLNFANHWLSSQNYDAETKLGPNQQFVSRRGYGDGLLKTAFGIDFRVGLGFHLMFEYAHWFPANDDPGDGYRFMSNHILAVAVAYHLSGA